MSVFLVPTIWISAFGGLQTLLDCLNRGEVHYTFVYPDGSLEVSTKDDECLRILCSDPAEAIVAPCAKISFRSLAPFGAIPQRIVVPRRIEKKSLHESFFVYPAPAWDTDEAEYKLETLPLMLMVERPSSKFFEFARDILSSATASLPQVDPDWAQICVPDWQRGETSVSGCLNIAGCDQRAVNWIALSIMAGLIQRKSPWGQVGLWFCKIRRQSL